ncbi:MAG TPA: hypothetical protein VN973_09825 [Candidatus Dormibacteraeota bacterium]|nr:hypothetical protein [Candidatus Dormibacteraeota bacterium]
MNTRETGTATIDRPTRAMVPYRLVFPNGVANLNIRVSASMPETYRGEFYGPKPRVTEIDGVISIDYPRFNPLIWGRTSADVTLSPTASWSIEVRGGVSRWDGDLRNIGLKGIEIRGGLSNADLRLPQPTGTVPVHVSGGVSHLTLHRPGGVPARVHIRGGASKLELDAQYLGAIGGPIRLETPGYPSAADRYDLDIGGGASKITVVGD